MNTDGMTLVEFLRARLDEDEASARAASPGRWTATGTRVERGSDTLARLAIPSGMYPTRRADAEHIARWDPVRVLAEIEAKRHILRLLEPPTDVDWFCEEIAAVMAQPYADHPDYDEAWRP